MDGIEFYVCLRYIYTHNGQPLYGNFTFNSWLYKPLDGTFSFRFNVINNNPKAIPRNILIAAWDANQHLDDNWIEENFELNFHHDCRLHMLNFLVDQHNNLR